MKDKMITIKVTEEFRTSLQELAKEKGYNNVSKMICDEYELQIEQMENKNNKEYNENISNVIQGLFNDVHSKDETTNELLKFMFEYMLNDINVVISLFNKYLSLKK